MQLKDIKHIIHHNHYALPAHWVKGWLLHCINKTATFLITDDDYTLTHQEYQKFHFGIQQMQAGTPLAYLLGVQAFFGHEFMVNEHTLIPRPDTEILVEKVLDFVKNNHKTTGKILDMGTGSGCIAISLAKALPKFDIVACDYSIHALEIAKKNTNNLQANNCTFVQSDWYQNITGKFDIIVSNPPYIAKDDGHLDKLNKEPITALVADNNGLSDIEHIITHASNHLYSDGLLVIEHGYNQSLAVQALFRTANFQDIATQKDYGGNDRISFGRYYELD